MTKVSVKFKTDSGYTDRYFLWLHKDRVKWSACGKTGVVTPKVKSSKADAKRTAEEKAERFKRAYKRAEHKARTKARNLIIQAARRQWRKAVYQNRFVVPEKYALYLRLLARLEDEGRPVHRHMVTFRNDRECLHFLEKHKLVELDDMKRVVLTRFGRMKV